MLKLGGHNGRVKGGYNGNGGYNGPKAGDTMVRGDTMVGGGHNGSQQRRHLLRNHVSCAVSCCFMR